MLASVEPELHECKANIPSTTVVEALQVNILVQQQIHGVLLPPCNVALTGMTSVWILKTVCSW